MTVDVKGNSPLWLKVKDLAEGMTYRFRIRAKTFTYGPEIEANVTTGPGEGRGAWGRHGAAAVRTLGSAPQVGKGHGGPWESLEVQRPGSQVPGKALTPGRAAARGWGGGGV